MGVKPPFLLFHLINMDDAPTINYTVKELVEDLHRKQDKTHETLELVLAQAKLTNGRVTALEKVSIGNWIRNNPGKFVFSCLVITSAMSATGRELILEIVRSLL